MTEFIELTIDGVTTQVPQGSTILEAAQQAGIDIPVLCYFAHTTSNGLCRLCVVEIEGNPRLQASCVTQAQPGAVVHTNSPDIDRVRRTILEMLVSTVDLSESSELKAMLEAYKATPERFDGGQETRP